ncbi:NADPH dehydrogenase NamA [Paenibacillus turpanensis]|uniref:NADPH dehydrogenase NamA n=1 Tax=Paenibacillus turpanensis TaxID=2689078 RepID=UPI00140CB802|nr:NADPH dehydrogenase NamA [Paenibacillus turpanensis]
MAHLFSEWNIRGLTLKNRIVMSPMCMYSCLEEDGKATSWHDIHYASRAVGQVGLIVVEATAIAPEGRISPRDLGIWEDGQIAGLQRIVSLVHERGSKIGIQLAHAGRKSEVEGTIFAPSAIPFQETSRTPQEMTVEQIRETVNAFAAGAKRAKEAGFDVIEIHAAHGYLINEFLSPLSNRRDDEYGGDEARRYRLLSEVIDAVRGVWDGPLFVRISANDYHPEGNTPEVYVRYAVKMKEQGVDLIDCSSGAVVPARIPVSPGYQVPYAAQIRSEAGIATGAVGLITEGPQAEQILQDGSADLIFIGRELLRDPYWPRTAAQQLGAKLQAPVQYERGWA